jgi:hypothetical protein
MSEQLHVVIVHFNPWRLKVRPRLCHETIARLKGDGRINLVVVEVGFNGNPYEVSRPFSRHYLRLWTNDITWNKEAAINAGFRHVAKHWPNAKYIAWIDGDVEFTRPDWASAAITQLQHHPAVQLFSNAIDLSPKNDFMGRAHGFAKLYLDGQRPGDFERNKNKYPTHMHPGYGWAFRRETWEAMSGAPTFAILGSGDHIMACGMVGLAKEAIWPDHGVGYRAAIAAWGEVAYSTVRGDIGYVEGMVLHHFHGYKEHRQYKTRNQILGEHKFDPDTDLWYDHQGLPHLHYGKEALRADMRTYMLNRKEYDLQNALDQDYKSRPILHKIVDFLRGLINRLTHR